MIGSKACFRGARRPRGKPRRAPTRSSIGAKPSASVTFASASRAPAGHFASASRAHRRCPGPLALMSACISRARDERQTRTQARLCPPSRSTRAAPKPRETIQLASRAASREDRRAPSVRSVDSLKVTCVGSVAIGEACEARGGARRARGAEPEEQGGEARRARGRSPYLPKAFRRSLLRAASRPRRWPRRRSCGSSSTRPRCGRRRRWGLP